MKKCPCCDNYDDLTRLCLACGKKVCRTCYAHFLCVCDDCADECDEEDFEDNDD